MNPEEKELLRRMVKLSEENNAMLRGIRKAIRWGQFWGFVKLLIILIPLIIGFWYLQPYFDSFSERYREVQELIKVLR